MFLLVGDLGGTKTVLGIAEITAHSDQVKLNLKTIRSYASKQFNSFENILQIYQAELNQEVTAAALAVAGPVNKRRCETTNLPWCIDADQLNQLFEFKTIELLNDLAAVAWGISALSQKDLIVIHPGSETNQGNACVVAAGTGLGQAGLYWDGTRHHPFATEGGHTDFAPTNELEYELLIYLKREYGEHVSWERVVSGPGILNLYKFLLSRHDSDQVYPAWLREVQQTGGDLTAAIVKAASTRRCKLSREALDLFINLYGREVGNAALKHLALGGVFLSGGVALKNLDLLQAGEFLAGFFAKGRMDSLLRQIPIWVIINPHVALLGAANFITQQFLLIK